MSAYHRQFIGQTLPFLWVAIFLLIAFSALTPAHSTPTSTPLNTDSGDSMRVIGLIKLGPSGGPLSDDAQQWSCVQDQQTGLTWEKRDPTTALHGHDSYNWYQPEHVNPGSPRAHPDISLADSTCYGFNPDDPASFCNSSAYADRVNQSNYCGHSDWRLPTADELLTLVDDNRKANNLAPLLDTRFFPFHDPFLYWTNTVSEQDVVITVFADDRVMENSERSDNISIRLVRGG